MREIRGDIVLDRSAFARPTAIAPTSTASRCGPTTSQPDALLLNFKSVTYSFVPDVARGVARVLVDPPLAGDRAQRTVRLTSGPCGDWRAALKASFADPADVRFAGSYPVACGERAWPVADAQPASYNARLIEALWHEMGGKLGGQVRRRRGARSA